MQLHAYSIGIAGTGYCCWWLLQSLYWPMLGPTRSHWLLIEAKWWIGEWKDVNASKEDNALVRRHESDGDGFLLAVFFSREVSVRVLVHNCMIILVCNSSMKWVALYISRVHLGQLFHRLKYCYSIKKSSSNLKLIFNRTFQLEIIAVTLNSS